MLQWNNYCKKCCQSHSDIDLQDKYCSCSDQ